jgi:hypothetical protein
MRIVSGTQFMLISNIHFLQSCGMHFDFKLFLKGVNVAMLLDETYTFDFAQKLNTSNQNRASLFVCTCKRNATIDHIHFVF